jgi:glyceraldehyde 3-phosphate dehydrogenase
MTVKVGINGLGRIGRCIFRAISELGYDDVSLVAVNGPAPIETHLHLLKYDSIHGRFNQDLTIADDNSFKLNGKNIKLFRERDPKNIPWGKLGVDIVFECTGIFNDKESASAHIAAGAKKVIISAPAKDDETPTIVYGVNHNILAKTDDVISIGSCTTNCLAPVAKALDEKLKIVNGFVTTIHSYTNDQNIIDGSHKNMRRARAAGLSMIPTSTGAAKAIGKVIPHLNGKLDGVAVRVPTANVSMIDFCFTSEKQTSVEEVNSIIKAMSEGEMQGVLKYDTEELVSIDYNHSTHSSIFDSTGTKVLGGDFIRVSAWYDNEWAFSNRMIDVAILMNKML